MPNPECGISYFCEKIEKYFGEEGNLNYGSRRLNYTIIAREIIEMNGSAMECWKTNPECSLRKLISND